MLQTNESILLGYIKTLKSFFCFLETRNKSCETSENKIYGSPFYHYEFPPVDKTTFEEEILERYITFGE